MKFPFYFFSFLLAINTYGQSVILLEEDTVSLSLMDVDISNQFIDFPLDLYYSNNTEDSINVNWRREFGENCPTEWDVFSADQLLSYVPQINESQVPLPMAPSDSDFVIRQSFMPRMTDGCCDIKMIFSLEGAPDNPIDTGYYRIEINADGCLTTSLTSTVIDEVSLFPNPCINHLYLQSESVIKRVEISDLSGKIHYSNTQKEWSQIDVSSLATGLYVCKMIGKNSQYWIEKFYKL